MDVEKRALEGIELRDAEDGVGQVITGYAAVFDKWSPDYGGFREIVRPGAFADSLASKRSNVVITANHNVDRLLGSQNAGATVVEDKRGLRYTVPIPDTTVGRDVAVEVGKGIMGGSSFAFTTRKNGDRWEYDEKGLASRELLSVDVLELGPVVFPFYPTTTAAARSLERWQQERRRSLSVSRQAWAFVAGRR